MQQEPSQPSASQQRCAAMVFTMPVHNDGISLTREPCRPRNIKVAAACPPSMQREGLW